MGGPLVGAFSAHCKFFQSPVDSSSGCVGTTCVLLCVALLLLAGVRAGHALVHQPHAGPSPLHHVQRGLHQARAHHAVVDPPLREQMLALVSSS